MLAPSTLRSHVVWLVFATALPLILFAGAMTYISYQQQQAAIEDGMIDTARALSLAVDKELESAIRALHVMAASEHLTSGELRQFHSDARDANKAPGAWESVALLDPRSKRVLLNTRFPFGAELPPSIIPEFIENVVRTGEAAVSGLFVSPSVGVPLVIVAVPVIRDGKVQSVLAASSSPAIFLKLLREQRVAPDRIATLIDRDQVVIARTREHEKFVGKRASRSFAAQAHQRSEASWRGTTLEGHDVVGALSRSALSGWTVGLATPAAVADAPLRNLLAIAGVVGLMFLGTGLLFAGFIARRISLAAEQLVGAAQSLGKGEVPRLPPQGVAEMNRVGQAIEDAAADRRRMEKTLHESEDRYRDLVEHSEDLICTHDLDGRLLSANPWAAKALGYAPAELLNMNVRDFIAPELRQEADAYFAKIKADGIASGVFQVRTRSGEKRVWEYTNTLRTDGVAAPIVRGMAHDVTEQRRAEKALRKSEARFKSLTELSSDWFWEQDENFRFTFMSGDLDVNTGISSNEHIGKTRWEMPALNLTESDWAAHRTLLGRHEPFHDFEMRRPDQADRMHWVSISGEPTFDATGRFTGYHGVGRDITGRKRSELALRGYAERLETLSRQMITVQEDERRFLARELHDEIGQALTAVKLNLQSLRGSSPAARAAAADSLEVLNTAIERVRSLSLDLRPQILDDLGIVAALRWYCRRAAERSGLRVDFQADPVDLAHAQTLATVCYRIAQEAVTNALRHAQAKNIRVELRAQDGWLRLSIEDDGAGMDTPARRAAAQAGGSSGLLSMEERAALAGGRLQLFSQPGAGTRVVAEIQLEETRATV